MMEFRLEQLSAAQFGRLCRDLNAEWLGMGAPKFELLPRGFKEEWEAVAAESERRGVQLRLF